MSENEKTAEQGAMVFQLDGQEVLRFEPGGVVFVRGEKVDNNFLVYSAFQMWLAGSMLEQAKQQHAMAQSLSKPPQETSPIVSLS